MDGPRRSAGALRHHPLTALPFAWDLAPKSKAASCQGQEVALLMPLAPNKKAEL